MFILLFVSLCAQATVELPAIVKEGTPGDLLMQDPTRPAWQGNAQSPSSSGSLQGSLLERIPVPVTGAGTPGAVTQMRGLGRSAEATDVQALGVPLNPPQGGGFDLSIFPQFLWAGYQYQVGPAIGTFDPRGTAGSLVLTPWTAQALSGVSGWHGNVAGLASSARLYQVSGAATDGEHVAVVLGSSSGDAQGPSGGLSARWRATESQTVSAHVLATDLDAKVPGSATFATPYARQRTARAIPLVQLDTRLGEEGVLKDSVYADFAYLNYKNPFDPSTFGDTKDHVTQIGTEHALLWGAWRFGLGGRGVRYDSSILFTKDEWIGHALVSRSIELGSLLIEPTVRAVGVTGTGVSPEGSLGARLELPLGLAAYGRGSYARQFPSMVNRFYSYPGYVANPDLGPEQDWTAIAGVELKRERLHAGVEALGQLVRDAQTNVATSATTETARNSGTAHVASLLARAEVGLMPWLDVGLQGTGTRSRIDQTGLAYPGLPQWVGVASIGVHSEDRLPDGGRTWSVRAVERVSSSSVANSAGGELASYHQENIELEGRLGGWSALARVDDLSDQKPVFVKDYPSVGRVFSLRVSRAF